MLTRTYNKTCSMLAIAAVMWMSTAYVLHSQDWEPAHHEDHICELFSVSKHAISGSIITVPYVPHVFWTKAYDVLKPDRAPLPSYYARSPPLSESIAHNS
ncbi:conserved hypothetical protein [Vibrio nigripulchritudo MADA3029]|uniref:DUF2607 family protein n=1 Tax=Vibrio nigripulchritudo TaxID=28173 RepID=U4K905_9VIBR|nr:MULTISPECIES: DUF2607 family protein [Vibrio]UAB69995.1 DUF2607 family protein [Vibrio sp. SCSIO 43132]CCN46491.1 conserved hypothetical protein [Vibrio nigripulchritudo MADA3020]CCN51547.1 conserved hypothetical protein [Vibrio nigripulchritudo MADA3021]CCN59222.1 conserved hypothetical protein [Vibrio nigripulchritudo MADA3029]CCN69123.1 conserved hypothetical protein [Vibrio nigripulchritudo SFn118]